MKHRYLFLSVLMGLSFTGRAQGLYVPPDAQLTMSEGAILTTGGSLENQGVINTDGELITNGDLSNEGTLEFSDIGKLFAFSDVYNEGFLINNGIINLYGNWDSPGTYNTLTGQMVFLGGADQVISNGYLSIENLTVNKIGSVILRGDSVKVSGELSFEEGVLSIEAGSQFIVSSDAQISHKFGSTSYFEGEIVSRGSGYRMFPVGNGGFYGTLEFVNTVGANRNTEVGVSMIHENAQSPIPGDDLIGVSGENLWKVDLREGELDAVQLKIDFIAEDLTSFEVENEIRRKYESPVVAVSDSSAAGPFRSLGIESLIDTDSLTQGIIISGDSAKFTQLGSKYFAIGLAPQIDPSGEVYFPNVFAPEASDPLNQSYRVFGELIANSPFQIRIYNRFSKLVYQADNFEEANKLGWDGRNLDGLEEYTGMYYVFVSYAFEYDLEDIKQYSGSILLKR